MNYEYYKTARDASMLFLIEHSITRLPIDIGGILKKMNITVRKDFNMKPNERGYSVFEDNSFQIIVPDCPISQKRYTIMHEIEDEDSKDKDGKDEKENQKSNVSQENIESKESQEAKEHRNWRDTEKLTQHELDIHSNDHTHQTVLDKDLNELNRRESGSISPDHMAAYDKEGNAIKSNYANASHFDIVEDKNYGIEKDSGRNNLVNNICKQADSRNEVLGSHGATVHQTYRIDVSGHENITIEELTSLYDELKDSLPDNVDIEFIMYK